MSDYETLLFLERQEAFWKSRKLSGKARMILEIQNGSGKSRMILENPEWFWCITRPVMDPGPRAPGPDP